MHHQLLRCALPLLLLGPTLWAGPQNDTVDWKPVSELTLRGQAWPDSSPPFGRLPLKAKEAVRDRVWSLGLQSAGLHVDFESNASEIHARWSLTSETLAMKHMPASGVSGLDLYVRDGTVWRWLGLGQPTEQLGNVARLAKGLAPKWRTYRLYLPLYNGVSALELSVPAESELRAIPPSDTPRPLPIIFYGTSITQGACASRPGMTHAAILGRRLDRDVINLGFSGNGRMEAELGLLLAEIPAAAYVLDCLPNINAAQVAERTQPFVEALRLARPKTPILLVEDRSYGYAFLEESAQQRNESSRAALRAAHAALLEAGVRGLYYLPGANLLGSDGEGLVDGSHPSDLGFMRQADAFEPVLRLMLGN
ncbi:MAG: lysophospholipase L1-like esterase [Planctomycetota bacterium]|jgi:lysophospholipase L1-like esterase